MKLTEERNNERMFKQEAMAHNEKISEQLKEEQTNLLETRTEKERLEIVEKGLLRTIKRLEDRVGALKEE